MKTKILLFFMALLTIPRTPSEIAELHGVAPPSLSSGGEFNQVQIIQQNSGSPAASLMASAQLNPSYPRRLIFAYLWVGPNDVTQLASVLGVCNLLVAGRVVASLPLQGFMDYLSSGSFDSTIYPSIGLSSGEGATLKVGFQYRLSTKLYEQNQAGNTGPFGIKNQASIPMTVALTVGSNPLTGLACNGGTLPLISQTVIVDPWKFIYMNWTSTGGPDIFRNYFEQEAELQANEFQTPADQLQLSITKQTNVDSFRAWVGCISAS